MGQILFILLPLVTLCLCQLFAATLSERCGLGSTDCSFFFLNTVALFLQAVREALYLQHVSFLFVCCLLTMPMSSVHSRGSLLFSCLPLTLYLSYMAQTQSLPSLPPFQSLCGERQDLHLRTYTQIRSLHRRSWRNSMVASSESLATRSLMLHT
jgi:hypothetical protein